MKTNEQKYFDAIYDTMLWSTDTLEFLDKLIKCYANPRRHNFTKKELDNFSESLFYEIQSELNSFSNSVTGLYKMHADIYIDDTLYIMNILSLISEKPTHKSPILNAVKYICNCYHDMLMTTVFENENYIDFKDDVDCSFKTDNLSDFIKKVMH